MATTTITIARTGREWGHRRRMRTGLIAHDAARAQPGYTLFAPMYGDGTVYLVDRHGKVVHTWRLPYRPGLHGHLLANGHLLYGGKIMDDLERFEGWRRFKGGAVLEVDWTPQRQRPSAGHRGERDDVRRLRRRDDDGRRRRIFEVTRDGEVVCEYVSPHFFHEPSGPGFNNWVFRAFRYTAEEIEAARR